MFDIYTHFKLNEKGVDDFDRFHFRFREVNFSLWDLYDRGVIQSEVIRQDRFKQILETFNAHEEKLAGEISDHYLEICPNKINLIPHALETLTYLSTKYNLTIITNGFEEIQNRKITAGKIDHYFDHIITSHKAGHKKPAKEIFDYALKLNNISPHQAIMIGDNLITDIGGARSASIDTIFFNPQEIKHNDEVKYEIKSLKELTSFL